MTNERALEIALQYVKESPLLTGADISGKMDGKILIYFHRKGSGHLGLPIFATIDENENMTYIEGMSNALQALRIRRAYLHLD